MSKDIKALYRIEVEEAGHSLPAQFELCVQTEKDNSVDTVVLKEHEEWGNTWADFDLVTMHSPVCNITVVWMNGAGVIHVA